MNRKFLTFMLAGCAVIIVLTLCFCGLLGFFIVSSFNTAAAQLQDATVITELCDANEGELNVFYHNMTTSGFREQVSFTQFLDIYKEGAGVFQNCNDGLGSLNVLSILDGTNVNYENNNGKERVTVRMVRQGKVINFEAVKVSGEWKLDVLEIV